MMTLPCCAAQYPTESLQTYGIRVLAFVLDSGVTATINTTDLELADHMYPLVIAGRDILPLAIDRLSAARHVILQAIRFRKTEERSTVPVQVRTVDRPNQGPMAKLIPVPITQSPAGSFAEF